MRAALLFGLVVGAAWLTAPAAEAKTSVSVDGTVVTITVPVDILGLGGGPTATNMDTGETVPLGPYLEQGAEGIWNVGFAQSRYRDCLTFRLDVQLGFPSGRRAADGNHWADFDPTATVNPRFYDKIAKTPNEDTVDAYTRSQPGDMPPVDSQTFAHEMGHLMGLGDDYLRDENGNVVEGVADGREADTLMHRGASTTITQAIVDRIGALIEEVEDLPECWTGTMEATGSYAARFEEGSIECAYAWDGDFRVVVAEEGDVSGDGKAAIESGSSCIEVLGQIGYPGKTPVSFDVAGQKDDDGYELTFAREQVASFPYHILTVNPPTLTIPLHDPCRAEATVRQGTEDFKRQNGVSGAGWDVRSRTRITLVCPSEQGER